jgi:hypothetical protein
MPQPMTDLTVRSESIQRLYNYFLANRFQVNRRYQRKLVWSVEEKERLVDSIVKDLPIPLFLVAEVGPEGEREFELIDGMQRMNAIFAFLENEFPLNGRYFDLEALADTKLRKDRGELTQKVPVLERETSTEIANYSIALSVFRSTLPESVDEVFRRINSGGRTLSRQGLRQAGTISSLADAVRIVSSRVRGDTSPSDSVPLRLMPNLSITNKKLDYGVDVDEIFWVRQGILRREEVRESTDEQLVLDILIDMLIDPVSNSGTRYRDYYYDYSDEVAGPTKESVAANNAVASYGPDRLADDFMRTYDAVRLVLAGQGLRFANLIGAGSGGRSPRYFHGVFIAFYELMFKERMRLKDTATAATALVGVGPRMKVPGGGGDWTKSSKRTSFDTVKGVLRSSFEGPIDGDDLGRYGYASQLELVLGNALVEQQLFDCKQGFYTLQAPREFDETSFTKIARTVSAMANMGPNVTGYVVIGIADNEKDAAKVHDVDKVQAETYRGFRIVGIDREAVLAGKDLNEYWHWIMQRLETSGLDPKIALQVKGDARLVSYGSGKAVLLVKVDGGSEPNFFKEEMYERAGSDTTKVDRPAYMRVYGRFTGAP